MAKKKPKPAAPPPPTDGAAPNFKDRIIGFERIKASDLKANPMNWRMHPESQKGAMRGVLGKVGYVDAIIVRDTPTGREIVNGHLRQDISGDQLVPVLITDLNDEEAALVLATFDPLSTMAVTDSATLEKLLASVTFDDNAEIRRLMADTMDKIITQEEGGELAQHEVPGMNLQPHEHYDYIVILADTTQDWALLCEKLNLVPEKRRGRMGTCRAVRAPVVLKAIEDGGKK